MLKHDVIRSKNDFSLLYKKGKSIGSKYVVLFFRKNNLSYCRKAFVASKKVGKSVARNRARRLMKESYRKLEGNLPDGYDILLIARNTISSNDIKCADVELALKHLFKKSGLFDK
jgi:ribonuclease P protein component